MMNDPGRNFWNSRNSNREFLDNDLAVSRGISQRAAKFLDTQYKAKMDHLRELYPYHYPQPRYNAILPRILWRDPRLVRAPFDIFRFLLVLVRCSRIFPKFWWTDRLWCMDPCFECFFFVGATFFINPENRKKIRWKSILNIKNNRTFYEIFKKKC